MHPPREIFKAYDIRGIVGRTLTPAVVEDISRAIGSEARDRGRSTIAIGRDGRHSGPELAAALARGLQASGADVIDVGQVATPMLYFAAHELGTLSGVMVTGSHNPPDYNGLKVMLAGDTLFGDAIQALRARIERADLASGSGSYTTRDVRETKEKLDEAQTRLATMYERMGVDPPSASQVLGIDRLIAYSVKANGNLAILRVLGAEGAGADIVSGGELFRALRAGVPADRIVFSGVGKTVAELAMALEAGIYGFNVESEGELRALSELAGAMGVTAPVALRINPDVDPATHVYISTGKRETKFGVDLQRAEELLKDARRLKRVRIAGLHVHIGSQITKTDPYVDTLTRLNEFIPRVREQGHPLSWLDMGGGFGIWYKDKAARTAADIAAVCLPLIAKTGLKLILEPGRFIVGNAGILLTRVLYVKDSGDKKFIICDAGMHDLIRPALYGAYHRIWPAASVPTLQGPAPDEEQWTGPAVSCDVVGPICESADFLAKDRRLPPVQRGDLLAVFSAGAYGFVMASNYNSFPRPAEVLVSGSQARVVTKRQTYDDVLAGEKIESF